MKCLTLTLVFLVTSTLADSDVRAEAGQYIKDGEYTKAAAIYEKLSANGDADAEYTIGIFYEAGWHYDQNYQKAIRIYQKLCEKYVEPCTSLGDVYVELGQYDLAEIAYLKAANSGDLRAYGNLGILYYNKKWNKFNSVEAKRWYQMLEDADREAYDQRNNLTKHPSSKDRVDRSQ